MRMNEEQLKLLAKGEKLGIPYSTMRHRIFSGNTDEKFLFFKGRHPCHNKYHVIYNGKKMQVCKAVPLATKGFGTYASFVVMFRNKEKIKTYKGKSLQQCFDIYTKRILKKWGTS